MRLLVASLATGTFCVAATSPSAQPASLVYRLGKHTAAFEQHTHTRTGMTGEMAQRPGAAVARHQTILTLSKHGRPSDTCFTVTNDAVPALGLVGHLVFTGIVPATSNRSASLMRLRGGLSAMTPRIDADYTLQLVNGSFSTMKTMASRGISLALATIAKRVKPAGTLSARDRTMWEDTIAMSWGPSMLTAPFTATAVRP